jgi:hypothetical protein
VNPKEHQAAINLSSSHTEEWIVIEKIHRFSLSELIYQEERGSKDKVNTPEETKAVKSDMQRLIQC